MVRKAFLHPLFVLCAVLFVLHQVVQKLFSISLPLADSYLDTLLVMPILLTMLQAERQWIFGVRHRLSLLDILAATLWIAVASEFVFPLLSDRFTADVWDAVMLSLGSAVYAVWVQARFDCIRKTKQQVQDAVRQ